MSKTIKMPTLFFSRRRFKKVVDGFDLRNKNDLQKFGFLQLFVFFKRKLIQMPPKQTIKSDSSIQQSTWTVVQRKFTNLVDSQSGFSVSQRRHSLFDYEGLGYTSLKLDSNLMNKLEGGKVQKLCPTCLSILQK